MSKWYVILHTSLLGQIWSSLGDITRVSFPNNMSYQNNSSEIFEERVMVFSYLKIFLAIGVDNLENMENLHTKWPRKYVFFYHVIMGTTVYGIRW